MLPTLLALTSALAAPGNPEALEAMIPPDAVASRGPITHGLTRQVVGTSLILARDVQIDEIVCRGQVQLSRVRWSCELAAPMGWGELTISEGANVLFHYGDGGPAMVRAEYLSPPATRLAILGVTCDAEASLHAGGRLQSCALAIPQTVAGHDFAAGTALEWDADGRLRRAILYDVHELGGRRYVGGALHFNPVSGVVVRYEEGLYE